MNTFPPPTNWSEQLVAQNLGLARQTAWSFAKKTGQPYDDLEAIAFIGLIRGCRRYNPDKINPSSGKRYAISTIIVPFVQGEILHWFRDKGHAIKYPTKWREQWGKIQRLLADPTLTAQDVADQSGLSQDELDEMLGAMSGTVSVEELDGYEPVFTLDENELDRLTPLQELVRTAFSNLHPGDQGQLIKWWDSPRRHTYPTGPIQQFHRRLKSLLQGKTFSQLAIEIQVAPNQVDPKPKSRRTRRQMLDRARQLGFLVS